MKATQQNVKFEQLRRMDSDNPRTRHIKGDTTKLHAELYRPDLLASLLAVGITEPLKVVKGSKDNGFDARYFHILQGNTRHYCLEHAKSKGQLNGTFDTIPCFVYEGLTQQEIHNFLNDQAHKGLGRVQVFSAYCQLRASGESEAMVANHLRPQLDSALGAPKGKKVEEINSDDKKVSAKAYAAYRHGLLQHWDRLSQCPTVVQNVAMEYLAKGLNIPSYKETEDLLNDYLKDRETDPKINRDNTGKLFNSRWAKIQADIEKAKEIGETRGKSASMATKDQLESQGKTLNSSFLRAYNYAIRQTGEWTLADVPEIDRIAGLYQTGKADEANKALESLYAKNKPADSN